MTLGHVLPSASGSDRHQGLGIRSRASGEGLEEKTPIKSAQPHDSMEAVCAQPIVHCHL